MYVASLLPLCRCFCSISCVIVFIDWLALKVFLVCIRPQLNSFYFILEQWQWLHFCRSTFFLFHWLLRQSFLARNSTRLNCRLIELTNDKSRANLLHFSAVFCHSPSKNTAKHTFSSCCWCLSRIIDLLRNQLSVQRCVDQHLRYPRPTLMEYKLIGTSFVLHIDWNPRVFIAFCVSITFHRSEHQHLWIFKYSLRVCCCQVLLRSWNAINYVFMTTTKNYCY